MKYVYKIMSNQGEYGITHGHYTSRQKAINVVIDLINKEHGGVVRTEMNRFYSTFFAADDVLFTVEQIDVE